ncbi:MAG: hypothetical protein JW973_03160 [Bacteroidales bacterium]|nr:hypothetical protein [Bacteroidales bacterium]
MKQFLYLLIFCLSFDMSFSQETMSKRSHYLFPEFTRGIVLMKAGSKNETLLNYNSLTEEMVYEDKGEKYAMGIKLVGLIDTVFISDRKFIALNNTFVELLCHSTYDLYAEHKCRLKVPGKPDGYREASQTSAVEKSSYYYQGRNREKGNVYGVESPDAYYEMELPYGYETEPYTCYWLKENGELSEFINMRQIMKHYDDKVGLFKEYVKQHDVKYEYQESIVQLIQYLETN